MDDTIIAAMEKELAYLDAKATALRSVVALYRNERSSPTSVPQARLASSVRGGNDNTTATAVLKIARALCKATDSPVPTRIVLDRLIHEGVEIVGLVPQNVVSSILSRSDEFQSNGRSGWTLKNSGELAPNENEAPSGIPPEPQKPASWGVPPPLPAPE